MKVVSMKGQVVDMTQILAQHEETVAIGNARMNARGDLLGPGGRIVKTRDQVAMEFNSAAHGVKKVSLKELQPDTFQTPTEFAEEMKKKTTPKRTIVDKED